MTADSSPAPTFNWKAALLTVRTQIADYEREGTSTPGKLKRAARLRHCRLALRDCDPEHAPAAAKLRLALGEIEKAEKDDNWRRVAELIPRTLHELDDLIGRRPA
ncbi:MAG: hypothetical protein ACRD1L_12480 [Terriglobales bacterium]